MFSIAETINKNRAYLEQKVPLGMAAYDRLTNATPEEDPTLSRMHMSEQDKELLELLSVTLAYLSSDKRKRVVFTVEEWAAAAFALFSAGYLMAVMGGRQG